MNPSYNRSGRIRRRDRDRDGQGDAATFALTVQALVCGALLLLAFGAKKADGAGFETMKDRYQLLVTQSMGTDDIQTALGEGEGALRDFFASVERFLTGIIHPGQQAPVEEPPSEVEEIEPSEPEESVRDAFSFNYLEPVDTAPTQTLGMGGANPVAASGKNSAADIPEDSVFAPVILSSRVQPPVTGIITSDFAFRDHPVSGKADFHNGMDIAAEEGRDILAALPGEVVEAGWSDVYGNYLTLRHSSNLQTFYGHCSELIASEGMKVRQGERIAKVGSTGVTTGPHLHFSVLVDGKYTNPYWILKDNIKLVEGA